MKRVRKFLFLLCMVAFCSCKETENDLEERKAALQKFFDHSQYSKAVVTLLPHKSLTEGDMTDGWLHCQTEEGVHLYFDDYPGDFVFTGKYSFFNDMYDFSGYDRGDKFVIYYQGSLPRDGNMSQMKLITIMPEYQLIGSQTKGMFMGEEMITAMRDGLHNYLYIYDDVKYNYMSLEEAVFAVIKQQGYSSDAFHIDYLPQGGIYFTDGELSFTGTALFCGYSINSADESTSPVFVQYTIKGYEGEPRRAKQPVFTEILYNNSIVI